jgi:hypothetical protein
VGAGAHQAARRAQLRFRRDPAAYLAALEERLLGSPPTPQPPGLR